MRVKSEKILAALTVCVVLLCLVPGAFSANYAYTYELQNVPGGSVRYRLNVAVSESLLQYYQSKSHVVISTNDFAGFVTPYPVKPIADCLRSVYPDDETFADGVLMIVHQIPYQGTGVPKYPVETISANSGDCGLFSYVAASVLEAGGLNVVLLYYESEQHMNIGVSLPKEPRLARGIADYVVYDGARFYVAECTGDNWQEGWRVGECPSSLMNATAQIIPLANLEQSAPGQVSASYNSLEPSTLSLDGSPSFIIEGTSVTLSGRLSPPLQNETITLYVEINASPWSELCEVQTDSSGAFTYVWWPNASGVCLIRAGWSGNESFAPADSSTVTIMALSAFFTTLLIATVVLICCGLAAFVLSRKSRAEIGEPLPPAIPS